MDKKQTAFEGSPAGCVYSVLWLFAGGKNPDLRLSFTPPMWGFTDGGRKRLYLSVLRSTGALDRTATSPSAIKTDSFRCNVVDMTWWTLQETTNQQAWMQTRLADAVTGRKTPFIVRYLPQSAPYPQVM